MSAILRAFGIDTDSGQGAAILASYANKPDGEINRECVSFLVDLFHKARTIGVGYTLRELSEMHPVEREAARLAGERWEAAQALLKGRAARGGLDAAAVASILDGGELLQQALLDTEQEMLEEVKGRTRFVLNSHASKVQQ